MIQEVDQLGRSVSLNQVPRRIICLVPSISEFLYEIGLDTEVVGITKFCIHPENWHKQKIKVGGTKTLQLTKIHQLKPDLIIANKEENDVNQINLLCKDFTVFITNINSIKDASEALIKIGRLCNKEAQSKKIDEQLQEVILNIKISFPKKVLYFIWKNPWMVVGAHTYINDLLSHLGLINIGSKIGDRYPIIELEDLSQLEADYLFLASEPFPFGKKHLHDFNSKKLQKKIVLVNGEVFSWYGMGILRKKKELKKFLLKLTSTCQ